MPELPEVETVKLILEPQLVGCTIASLTLNRPEIVECPAPDAFAAAATGATITGMELREKYLSILLNSGASIVLHLRMTGCLLVTPLDYTEEKHTHLVFHLDNGNELRFVDPRRFGRFWLFDSGEEDTVSGAHKLGLEPFDTKLTAEYLSNLLSKRKRAVKSCLLEQEIIAGIGNIYADEILFAAKIRPDRAANTLTSEEWERLADTIPAVLHRAVEANSMTPEEYLAGRGQEYRNTPTFQVYGHAGEPCPRCSETLCHVVVTGRAASIVRRVRRKLIYPPRHIQPYNANNSMASFLLHRHKNPPNTCLADFLLGNGWSTSLFAGSRPVATLISTHKKRCISVFQPYYRDFKVLSLAS